MTIRLLISFSSLLFEDDYFIATKMRKHRRTPDRSAVMGGIALGMAAGPLIGRSPSAAKAVA